MSLQISAQHDRPITSETLHTKVQPDHCERPWALPGKRLCAVVAQASRSAGIPRMASGTGLSRSRHTLAAAGCRGGCQDGGRHGLA
jgi:hypothetical protein